jgi:DNA-binding NarL/FixJ family response regulator
MPLSNDEVQTLPQSAAQPLSLDNALSVLGLSQRETEVLACLIQGQDNNAIAQRLAINTGTVRKHLENIFRKLDVSSRTEAIAKVLEKLGFL